VVSHGAFLSVLQIFFSMVEQLSHPNPLFQPSSRAFGNREEGSVPAMGVLCGNLVKFPDCKNLFSVEILPYFDSFLSYGIPVFF